MKEVIIDFVKQMKAKSGIEIALNIGYYDKNTLYGSITVGHYGTMMYGTFQPHSDTTEQFKIDSDTGNLYDSNISHWVDGRPVWKRENIGHYKDIFPEIIKRLTLGASTWVFDEPKKKKYFTAIKKIG